MKFQTKLGLGFGGILLLLFILAGVSIRLMGNVSAEINTNATVYLPIQTEATSVRGNIYAIPGAVNLYLNTGQKQHWAVAEKLLEQISATLGKLSTSMAKTGLAEKNTQVSELSSTLVTFDKVLRETYANNEAFIATRQRMLADAAIIAESAAKMVTANTDHLEEAASSGNIAAIEMSRQLTTLSSRFSTSVGMLRASMLRSLATQDRSFAESNFKKHFPDAFQALDGMIAQAQNGEEKQKMQELRTKVELFQKTQQEILAQWDQKDKLAETRNRLREAATAQASAIADDSTAMQNKNMSDVINELESSITQTILIAAFALLAGIIVALLLSRNMLQQLGKDPGLLGSIAQRVMQGDYDVDDGSPRKGVYGNIVGMVEALKKNIDSAHAASKQASEESARAREAMAAAESASNEAQRKTEAMLVTADRLEQVSNVVSSASAELSAQIEQSTRGASEQAARVGETATAMEEMNSTVLEVARNAGSTSDVSTVTRDKAEAGAEVVRKSVESIQDVQRQSLLLKKDMMALGENAQSINQIMGVISDIADQTNLLALNAAIEAARAGEAGRGFAVVADEVRKLAEKTMASTTDVGNAIKAIQLSADKSMNQVDSAVKSIEEATEFATQSGVALAEIVGMVDKSADQVRAIATASEQQSATSEEINRSMTEVNTIASETARAMEEAAHAVSDLANQAQILSQLVDELKKG